MALLDACVLYSAPLRDLLMWLSCLKPHSTKTAASKFMLVSLHDGRSPAKAYPFHTYKRSADYEQSTYFYRTQNLSFG